VSSGSVTADGLTQLVGSLGHAAEELADLTEPHHEATRLVVSAAAPNTPRRSGALAAATRTDASAKVGEIYNTSDHAVPTHWGAPAKNVRARPWLYDTLIGSQSKVVAVYEHHVETTLDDVKGT
jgi:hypothetical protein